MTTICTKFSGITIEHIGASYFIISINGFEREFKHYPSDSIIESLLPIIKAYKGL